MARKRAASNPQSPALAAAKRAASRGVRIVMIAAAARIVARLVAAAGFALFAAGLIADDRFDLLGLALAGVGLIAAAALSWFGETRAARVEADTARAIEKDIERFVATAPVDAVAAQPRGALIAGLHRRPAALASLVVSHKTARSMLGVGAAASACAVAMLSWRAALVLALSLPILIALFIIVGKAIGRRARAQEAAFGKLSAQFGDRVRVLPTLLANHAVAAEQDKLATRMTQYADSVMGVLRVAFVNAGLIDFFSALSIALLAVMLGFGLLGQSDFPGFSGLSLTETLMILLFAPEFFTPLRRYAEQYHMKAEGEAAADALAPYYAEQDAVPPPCHGDDARIEGLVLPYAGPAPDFVFGVHGLVAVTGPSGVGKSTLLRTLAGVEAPVDGLARIPEGLRAWVSGEIDVMAGTIAEAIAHGAPIDHARLAEAWSAVGLDDPTTLPGGLEAALDADGANLSGGQRMRLAVARALYARARVIFADEPTAKLDAPSAAAVRNALSAAGRDALVIVATHDPELMRGRTLRLGDAKKAAA